MLTINGKTPQLAPTSWVAPTATLIGAVEIGDRASVWYGCVVRADCDTIAIGAHSNIQDLCALHADPGTPLTVGARVSVGHSAILHGCTVGDDVIVGMGAVILNGAVIGAGSVVGARALVPQGMVVPPGSLVLGMPAKVARPLTDAEREGIARNAAVYEMLAENHRAAHAASAEAL